MDVLEAVSSRYSCRAFLPTPIPEKIVREIVERAARTFGRQYATLAYICHRRQTGRGSQSRAGDAHGNELPKGEQSIPSRTGHGVSRSANCSITRSRYHVGQARALLAICAQLSIFWRAGRTILCP